MNLEKVAEKLKPKCTPSDSFSVMIKWFVYHNEEVLGPFSTEKIQEKSSNGQFRPEFLIWSCAQPQWSTLRDWKEDLPQILNEYEASIQKQLQHWYYTNEGKSHGPMPKEKLIKQVLQVENKQAITLWTEGMSSWRSIFEFNDILTEVGLNRRTHPRADIEGKATIKVDGQIHMAQLRTISPGGCGLTHTTNLSVGQRMHIEIQSEHFFAPLKATAEVRYISQIGFVGVKFEQIHMESQSAIIEYIKNLDFQSAS